MLHATRKVPDLLIQQSQKEFEHMARLQQERARDRQTAATQPNPTNDSGSNNISLEDLEEAKINTPTKPSFPAFIFGIALLKDLLDIATVGFGGWLISIFFFVIIWFWSLGKLGFVKKIIIKRVARRIWIGFIPFVNFYPEATLMILWAHARETEHVGKVLRGLEKIEA